VVMLTFTGHNPSSKFAALMTRDRDLSVCAQRNILTIICTGFSWSMKWVKNISIYLCINDFVIIILLKRNKS